MNEADGTQVEHEGEKYLRLLDFTDKQIDSLRIQKIKTRDGREIVATDYLDICRDEAMPLLVGYEMLKSEDPNRAIMRDLIRNSIISRFISNIEPTS